jgi:hypothetical protein
MVYKNKADPFLCKELDIIIHDLKDFTKNTMGQVHAKYSLKKEEISNDKFQEEVISIINKSLTKEFYYSLDAHIQVWTNARAGSIKQYFNERMIEDDENKRFLKIATRCNSKGGLHEILEEDLEPWIDSITTIITDSSDKKYLTATATRKQAIQNLKRMLDYPVTIREIEVKEFISEAGIETLLIEEPEKYLPTGAIKALKKNKELKLTDLVLVTANCIINKDETHRLEGRIKSSEALKWAKYITGIRDEPSYDGIGVIELGASFDDIVKLADDATKLKFKNNANTEYRYAGKETNKKPTKEEIKKAYQKSKKNTTELLKRTYLNSDGKVSIINSKKYKDTLVYGIWLDMNMKSNKSPIEIQFKDPLGYMLYGFNSPYGHNSKKYNHERLKQLYEKVEIGNREYRVDKITNHIANQVLLPAFMTTTRKIK